MCEKGSLKNLLLDQEALRMAVSAHSYSVGRSFKASQQTYWGFTKL